LHLNRFSQSLFALKYFNFFSKKSLFEKKLTKKTLIIREKDVCTLPEKNYCSIIVKNVSLLSIATFGFENKP